MNTPHSSPYFNQRNEYNNIQYYLTPYLPRQVSYYMAPIRRQLQRSFANERRDNNVRRQLFRESDDEVDDVQAIIEEVVEEVVQEAIDEETIDEEAIDDEESIDEEDGPEDIHLDEGSPLFIRQNAPLKRSRHELLSNVSKVSTVEGETFTCSICLETSEDMSKEWSKVEKCNHIFHTSCLQEWCQIDKTCPNCRHKLL
jgi:two-component sensor histidine kinase